MSTDTSAGPAPAQRSPGAGGSYTPVELAKLLRLHAPTREQAEIIAAPVEPLLVVAGAGSGKTETMAARVVWLVANGHVAPEQILGLTFTRKAAGELGTPDPHPARPARPPAGPAAARPGRRAARRRADRRHLPLVRGADRHRARPARPATNPSTRLLTEAARWQLVDPLVRAYDGDMSGVDRMPGTVTDAVLALSAELAEHLRTPRTIWPPGPAGSSPRCRPAPAGSTPTCARR